MTTRVEALIEALGQELERMKAEKLVPPGYEANIVLRSRVRVGGHLHIGETSTGDLSTALSELIDNPHVDREIEIREPGVDLPLCGQ